MPTLEAVRSALEKLVAGGAGDAERRLLGEAVRGGRVVLAEGARSVALGGSADGAAIVTGDGNVVFQLDAAAARELRALVGPPVPRQLPLDLADFTGRADEIAALERALGGDGGVAAITAIGGMGGVGKTALAVHVAHRLMERYPDGQIVVDLKGTSAEPLSPPAAMGLVITALDPARKLPDDDSTLAGLYRSLLGGKRLLILFDNAAAADQVRDLLPVPPGAAIVTSRRAVVLPGLERVPLDVLAPEEADALLLGIIGEGRAVPAERATLAERCGYLPLALRVAGTFLVSYADWGVAEYLAALADERERLRRLRVEGDALLDVAAVLGLSLRQLAHDRPELVVRWRMLAAFAGSFDRAAVAAVWAVAPTEARDGLSPLVERSMVLFDVAGQRYRLHDLMRDLALGAVEPLSEEEQGCLDEARDRHAAYFQRLLAEANGSFLQGGDALAAGLARFDAERANIEAGWRWLLDQAADDEAVVRRRSEYVDDGYQVLPLRQHPRVQIEWLETALAAARRLRDRRSEGATLGRLGNVYFNLGEHRRVIEFCEQVLAIARETGDRQAEGAALGNLGNAYQSLGEYSRAIETYKQHLSIAQEIGDSQNMCATLNNLGAVYFGLGDSRRAIKIYEQALAIARETGDRMVEGNALGNLGNAYYSLYEDRKAIDYHEQHLAIAREIGHRHGEGAALLNAALAFNATGARDEAVTRVRAAIEVFAAVESPYAEKARAQLAVWQGGRG